MRRFYSHYAFIYPDIYLRNYVLEFDPQNRIINYFLFKKEIENTLFYSGLLVVVPADIELTPAYIPDLKRQIISDSVRWNDVRRLDLPTQDTFLIYDEDGNLL